MRKLRLRVLNPPRSHAQKGAELGCHGHVHPQGLFSHILCPCPDPVRGTGPRGEEMIMMVTMMVMTVMMVTGMMMAMVTNTRLSLCAPVLSTQQMTLHLALTATPGEERDGASRRGVRQLQRPGCLHRKESITDDPEKRGRPSSLPSRSRSNRAASLRRGRPSLGPAHRATLPSQGEGGVVVPVGYTCPEALTVHRTFNELAIFPPLPSPRAKLSGWRSG
ncbi:uncharacterized protein LOC123590065 [Leopardus geoffroyi]|uniref:uncharacterized protein LOC123590065 n=1 Tax=Leopardus geoffroyi TaxID=46844 RepID=UPI001E25DB66|nr:uncharacterized protein LOC123590065 [Leopardus geoffroyi]